MMSVLGTGTTVSDNRLGSEAINTCIHLFVEVATASHVFHLCNSCHCTDITAAVRRRMSANYSDFLDSFLFLV